MKRYTPKLIFRRTKLSTEMIETNETRKRTEQLFDQDINEEEDFEIPAFLRKQKF
jgi:hypothetical protein